MRDDSSVAVGAAGHPKIAKKTIIARWPTPDEIAARNPKTAVLLERLKRRLPKLEALRAEIDRLVDTEDLVYRYYHQSWKVYYVQKWTAKIRDVLLSLCPTKQRILDPMFEEIVAAGLPGPWEKAHNRKWSRLARPQLEAFWHARYFLDMAIKYGRKLRGLPPLMPSGWAALLELYYLRYGDLQLTLEIERRRKLGHASTSGKP